jgi:hypothetical protein
MNDKSYAKSDAGILLVFLVAFASYGVYLYESRKPPSSGGVPVGPGTTGPSTTVGGGSATFRGASPFRRK